MKPTWKDGTLTLDGATVGGVFSGSNGERKAWSWWVGSLDRRPTHNASNAGEWHATRKDAQRAADAFCAAQPDRFVAPKEG